MQLQNSEAKVNDLEMQLRKAHNSVKTSSRDINNLNKTKEQIKETLDAKLESKDK